jgi:hypothetical protein
VRTSNEAKRMTAEPITKRRLYVVAQGRALTNRLVQELLADGLTKQDIRLFSRQPNCLADISVSVTSLSVAPGHVLLRALAGAAIVLVALVLWAIAFGRVGSPSLLSLLLTTLAGGAVGAGTDLLQPFPAELRPLRGELRPDDVVLRADVPATGLGPLEEEIKARHPEIRVMGTDPGGTPPFP